MELNKAKSIAKRLDEAEPLDGQIVKERLDEFAEKMEENLIIVKEQAIKAMNYFKEW